MIYEVATLQKLTKTELIDLIITLEQYIDEIEARNERQFNLLNSSKRDVCRILESEPLLPPTELEKIVSLSNKTKQELLDSFLG